MAATIAGSGGIRKNVRLPKQWDGESRKKREAQAEPTFFDGPAGQAFGQGSAKGVHEAAMLREHPHWESSEVARFRWEPG